MLSFILSFCIFFVILILVAVVTIAVVTIVVVVIAVVAVVCVKVNAVFLKIDHIKRHKRVKIFSPTRYGVLLVQVNQSIPIVLGVHDGDGILPRPNPETFFGIM